MKPKLDALTPKALRTRLALIEAAKVLIGREGAAGLNVMTVCAEASVGRTSFYNYFEDVDALVAAVAMEAATEIKARFDQLHEDYPRGRKRLENCLSMILSLAKTDTETVLLLTSLANVIPEIAAMIEAEIVAELSADPPDKASEIKPLAQYLTITTMTLARRMAIMNTAKNNADQYLRFLMRACD